MNKYEAMLILKPDLAGEEQKQVHASLHDIISKFKGSVTSGSIWVEKKRLNFPIKRYQEGTYYLMHFDADPTAVKDIRQTLRLNEHVLRFLIVRGE